MEEQLTFKLPLSSDERQRLRKRQAQDLFAPLHNTAFQRVEISGCALPNAAASVAAAGLSALSRKRCLRDLVLSDCIAGLAPEEALKTLTALCEGAGSTWKGLRSVDLSSNALGSRGVAACTAVLVDQPLEEVYLSNNGLSAASVRMVRSHLCTQAETQLRVLHCTLNCIESDGLRELVRIVKQSPRLEQLRFSSLRADADAVRDLCVALQSTDRVRLLDLSDNGFDSSTARALGDALSAQRALEALMLRDLSLPADDLRVALAPLLATETSTLATLDLSGNELGPDGVDLVKDILHSCKLSLRCLYLADNELAGKGAMQIANALEEVEPSALRMLSIAGNFIRDVPLVTVAEQVLNLTLFESIDIDENYGTDDTIKAIRDALGDALAPTDKMVPEEEQLEEDEDEDEEIDLQSALSRLFNRVSKPREQSPTVPNLMRFDAPLAAVSETSTVPDMPEPSFDSPSRRLSTDIGATSPPPDTVLRAAGPVSPSSRQEVYSSARKLNKDLADIRESLSGFVAELNEVKDTGPRTLAFEDEVDEMLVADAAEKNGSAVLDVVGGFMVALFVVILVLSIAKSQEETTFSYRPV